MYGADQDLLGLLKDAQCPVPILVIFVRSFTRRELFEIYAGAEGAARAPYERDSDVGVVTDHFRGSIYLERALVIHRVKYLWTVQRQVTYSAGILVIHRFKFHRYSFSPPRINHEETKTTKVFSCSSFVFFISSWLIFNLSGRHSLRHERLLRESTAKKRRPRRFFLVLSLCSSFLRG